MRSRRPVIRFTVTLVAAAALTGGCGSGNDDATFESVDGAVLSVVPDLSDEPPDVAFAAVPDLLVTEDGRAIYAPPAGYAFQGTLVPDVWVVDVSPAGIELVRAAVSDGAPPLNIDELSALVGPELADAERYFPDTFRLAAVPFGPVADFDDPDTPLVEWPSTASISLADALECTRLPELEVGEVLVTAAQSSAFVDQGIVYGVVAAPDWPGAPCVLPD